MRSRWFQGSVTSFPRSLNKRPCEKETRPVEHEDGTLEGKPHLPRTRSLGRFLVLAIAVTATTSTSKRSLRSLPAVCPRLLVLVFNNCGSLSFPAKLRCGRDGLKEIFWNGATVYTPQNYFFARGKEPPARCAAASRVSSITFAVFLSFVFRRERGSISTRQTT